MNEPVRSQLRYLLERAGFFKEMRRPRNNLELHFASHSAPRRFVHADHDIVRPADEKKRRRLHLRQCIAGEIGTAATGDNRADVARQFRRRDEGSAATGARSEITDSQLARRGVLHCPMSGMDESLGEEADVEAMLRGLQIDCFFFACEQVEKQCRQTCLVQSARNGLIARAMPAAPAAMGEEDEHGGPIRQSQRAVERRRSRWDLDFRIRMPALSSI